VVLDRTCAAAIARGVSSWTSRRPYTLDPGPIGALMAVIPIAVKAPMVRVVERSEAFVGGGRLSANHPSTRCGDTVSSAQKTMALLPE
jgi:hypothetical protein